MNRVNVPKLRFPGFDGAWEEKKLQEVSSFLDGRRKPIKSGDRSKMKGEYPYYGASGIIDYVNNYIFDEELILLGEDGENIISRNSPLAFRVSGKCWINNHAHVIVPKDNTNIDFLTHNLERINYVVYNTGTAQPKLNQEVCRNIPSWFPTLPEQQKIASFLSAVDEKIQQLSRKKELLEHYKKGVMQQLFSDKLRFKDEKGKDYPDWEEKKLGEISNIKKGQQLNKIELTDSGEFLCINGGISPSGYTDKFNTLENTITISEGGNSCGFINFFRCKFWSGGHNYTIEIIKPEETDNYFMFQILKHNQINIMGLRVGSGLPNIQKKDLFAFLIKLPTSIKEQQKIANFLSSIDAKIENTIGELEKVQLFKKGLLQKMFV